MKIFVGYGFRDNRDKWIPDLIYPIIKAFGDEVVTGEDLPGEQITDAVIQKISDSDALIGFLTRRGDPDAGGIWKTHRWVIEEIATAINKNKKIVEIREAGVDDQGGIVGDRQRIPYEEADRDKCLVKIIKAIGQWHSIERIKLKLLPEDCIQDIFPLLRNADLRCTYKIMTAEGEEKAETVTKVVPVNPGGLFIFAKDVPRQALIQVHIEHQGKHWLSSFETTDSLGIHLRKES